MSLSRPVYKAVLGAALGAVADRFIQGETNVQSNLLFGAATGAGLYAGSMIAAPVASLVPSLGEQLNSVVIATRAVEVAGGSAGGYALNKYILGNDYSRSTEQMWTKLGIVVGCDFLAEMAADRMYGTPYGYFDAIN